MPDLQLTVLIATHNRCSSLEKTLNSLIDQDTKGLSWEVVVANNGSTDPTSTLLEAFSDHLPLQVVSVREPSHSLGVNAALGVASGNLVIFTDDDVAVSKTWLQDYVEATREFEDSVVFCGPILPVFPEGAPQWLKRHPLQVPAYAHFDLPIERGYLPLNQTPFGPNFGVRRAALTGMQYRTDLGPSLEHGPLSFDDTEFLIELRRRYSPFRRGGGFVYIPTASVSHFVRENQLTTSWLYARFFHFGRSAVVSNGMGAHRKVPSALVFQSLDDRDDRKLELAAELNYYLGELYQLISRGDRARTTCLVSELRRLQLDTFRSLVCEKGLPIFDNLLLRVADDPKPPT